MWIVYQNFITYWIYACIFLGFIATVIKSLWGALEVVDDSPVVTPKSWPVTPLDKTSKKVFYSYIYIFWEYHLSSEIIHRNSLGVITIISTHVVYSLCAAYFCVWFFYKNDKG